MSIDKQQFTQVLLSAQNPDPTVQKPAEKQLLDFETADIVSYLSAICTQIADSAVPENARLLAVIRLKNAVSSNSGTVQQTLSARWLNLDMNLRAEIRKLLLATMASTVQTIRNMAAAAVASIAATEIPNGQWTDLMDVLVNAVMDKDVADFLKQASLSVLGDICQTISSDTLGSNADKILTAIASAIQPSSHDILRLAATRALTAALKFCERNFSVPHERELIMNMAQSVLDAGSDEVKEAGWECLGEIADLYYAILSPFLSSIFAKSLEAIKTHDEKVAMMAIEFWTVVSKHEAAILEDMEYCEEDGTTPAEQLMGFSANATEMLVPALLEALTKQDEDADDDSWNVCSAAGLCLTIFAQVVGKKIFPFIMPVVTRNVQDANWRYRDAAMTAFGCVLNSPDVHELHGLVAEAVPVLIQCLRDPQPHVRDSTAWCFSQVCANAPEVFASPSLLISFMEAALLCLSDRVRTANNICKGIYTLAETINIDETTGSSALSQFFQGLVGKLLEITDLAARPNTDITLLVNGYEAISQLIKYSAPDVHHHVIALLPLLGTRLAQTTAQNMGSGEHKGHAQALLCGSLESIVHILEPEEVTIEMAQSLIDVFTKVLSTDTGVNEEALLGICAVARQLEQRFVPFMDAVFEPLMRAVQDKEATHVCRTAVTTLSGIVSGMGETIAPYADRIVNALVELVQDPALERSIKPLAIEGLGDVAVALDSKFQRYLAFVGPVLKSAAEASVTTAHTHLDMDVIDYLLTLQSALLVTYDSLVVSMCSSNAGPAIKEFMVPILDYLTALGGDAEIDTPNVKKALNLILDIIDFASDIDATFPQFLKTHAFKKMIDLGRSSRKNEIKKIGQRCLIALQKL